MNQYHRTKAGSELERAEVDFERYVTPRRAPYAVVMPVVIQLRARI